MTDTGIGAPVRRKEDFRFLTGRGSGGGAQDRCGVRAAGFSILSTKRIRVTLL